MTASMARDDWGAVDAAFRAFFAGFGDVDVTPDRASFSAEAAGTGFELGRDGTSRSFMPLHGLDLRWESVCFDVYAMEVTVRSDGGVYTYRVPPSLIDSPTQMP